MPSSTIGNVHLVYLSLDSILSAIHLLHLLDYIDLLLGLVKQPESNKDQPTTTRDGNAGKVWPSSVDLVRGVKLVVGKVADSDRVLLLDVGQKGPLVVGQEVEYAMVVRDLEGDAVDALLGRSALLAQELEALEGGEHAELEL